MNPQAPEIISRAALARRLGVTSKTVTNWSRAGILNPIRITNRDYFRWSDVEKMLARHEVTQ